MSRITAMSRKTALSSLKTLKMAAALCAPLFLATALPAAAEDGETLYKIYCTQCHGVEGFGNGVNLPAMSVQPRNHHDRTEMGARTDEELFKAIKHGGKSINKSVLMPAWGENLNDDEINALVLYLRELCCNSGG